eukprot:m.14719 g.14719  ORF g.14719 m.14719 type:complete len:137 (-) comp10333_c0_seq1:908-1318(-)
MQCLLCLRTTMSSLHDSFDEQGQVDDDSVATLTTTPRVEAAVHYTVHDILKTIAKSQHVSFSKSTIATITKLTIDQAGILAEDVQAFAKHAKRATVQEADVKLAARRRSSLVARLDVMAQDNKARPAKKRSKSDKA